MTDNRRIDKGSYRRWGYRKLYAIASKQNISSCLSDGNFAAKRSIYGYVWQIQ